MAIERSNYLAEHEGVRKDKAPGYQPTEEEEKAIRLVEKLYSQAKRNRAQRDLEWIDNDRYFRGKQWKEKRPSYRHSEVFNLIFSEIQNVLVILTDVRPNIEYLPEDPTDFEFAEILTQAVKSKWDVNNWSAVLAECIIDACRYGTAIAEVPWKPELSDGLGDFTFETVDIFSFFPDTNARGKINDEYCDWVITAIPEDVGKLKRLYPKQAEYIKADVSDLSASDLNRNDTEDYVYRSPTDNRVLVDGQKPHEIKPNQVLKITCYLKSDETHEQVVGEELDAETGLTKKLYQTSKKYPNGRKICVANGVLLVDDENPYINAKFPYAKLVDHQMPREFFGIGEVEQLKSTQNVINKVMSYILDILTLMGNPIWIVDTSSGIDTENLTNQPGLAVEKNPGSEVRREEGTQLQPYIMNLLDFAKERMFQALASTGDISKGVSPSANASGYAIEQLQEAAQTKLRGKSRNIEMFLKDVGDLMVDRILQFYTLPRIVRITNNQNASKYFEFLITEKQDESGEVEKFAQISEFVTDPTTGNPQLDPMTGQAVRGQVREVPLKSRLDVRVAVGSSLPYAKAQKAATAERLLDRGIIDPEEFLAQIEYPNKDKVIEKLKQRQAEMPAQGDPNAQSTAPAGPTGSGPTGSGPTATTA